MKKSLLALIVASSMLTACGGSAPTGQVLATVNGEEITAADLSVELNGLRAPNARQQRQLEIAALQSIVNRMILAQAAHEEDADSTPVAATVKRKAEQLAVIQLLEQQIRSRVPAPSREEAQQYILDHPASFAQRRIYLVTQIIVPNPPESLIRALEPINTMPAVQAELAKYNIQARPAMGVIDALTIAPEAAAQIAGLAPNAVFIVPGQGSIRINQVRESQIAPVEGPEAIEVALGMIREQRSITQVGQQMQRFLEAGRANVQYNPEYDPARNHPPQAARPAGGQPAGSQPAGNRPAGQPAAAPGAAAPAAAAPAAPAPAAPAN